MIRSLLFSESTLRLFDVKNASKSFASKLIISDNVFYRYFDQYGYFDRARSAYRSVFQVRWQRQRDDSSHIFAIWRVSKLDFMIISPRAKSKMNFLQNSSQLRLLRKCTFASLMSCDTNLIKTYKYRLIKHVMCSWLCDEKTRKVHLRSKCNCDEFWRKFIFDFARGEIIIKSSLETRHIANKWDESSRCRCHRTWKTER